MSLTHNVLIDSDEKRELAVPLVNPPTQRTPPRNAQQGTEVEAESNGCEYKSLSGRSGLNNDAYIKGLHTYLSKPEAAKDINAMLNTPGGGEIHFGISDACVVEEGLIFNDEDRERVTKKASDIFAAFYPAPEQDLHQIEWINLDSGRQRFIIRIQHRPLTGTLRYHLLRRDKTEAL